MTPTAPTATPKNLLGATYEFMQKGDFDVPATYDEFEQLAVDDPAYLNDLHTLFKEEKWTAPENVDEFRANMLDGVKKKPSQDMVSGAGLPAVDGSVPGLAQVLAGTGSPDQPFAEQLSASPDRISPLSAIQKAPGDEYIEAGINPTMEQLRADEADKQPAATPAEDPNVADDGFWATLGKQLSNLPATLENVGGNLVDYFGDVSEMQVRGAASLGQGMANLKGNAATAAALEPFTIDKPLQADKATDKAGDFLRADAQNRTTLTSRAAQISVLDNPYNPAAWGNMLGQGANSVVAVGAASALGGPGAGIAAGAGLGISATKDAARQAGLSDKEAALTATVLAPIQGVLEEMGMGFITKAPGVNKLITSQIVKRALAYGEGKLARAGVVKAASELLPEIVKRVGVRAATGALGEGVTEFAQGEAEGIAKLAADAQREPGEAGYGISAVDALVRQPTEQAVAGALLGGLGGGVAGAVQGQPQVDAQPAPLQAADEPINDIAYTVRRPTGQVEMENVRVHAVSADGKTAVVRGVDGQGAPVEREVPTADLREVITGKSRPGVAEAPAPTTQQPAPVPEQTPAAEPRTITLPKPDGSPNFLIDVDASGQPTRLYTPDGRDFPLSVLETNPAVAAEVAKAIADSAPQADTNVGQSPAADPSIVDVTDNAPEPIPAEVGPLSRLPIVGHEDWDDGTSFDWHESPIPTGDAPLATGRQVDNAVIEEIPVDKIRSRQRRVTSRGVGKYMDGEHLKSNDPLDLPVVFEHNGEYHTQDGSHRITAAILRGDKNIRARVARDPNAPKTKLRPVDTVPVEPSPVEAPVPVAGAPDAEAGAIPAADNAAPSLAEQNQQAKADFSSALERFRAARKKGDNRLQASVAGIPAFSAEEAAAIKDMVKAVVKLGVVNSKRAIAQLRSMGLSEDDATDDQLRPLITAGLKEAGVFRAKKGLPANEPNGSATRKSMARLDADPTQPQALKDRVRDSGLDKYEPKSLAETNTAVDAYMQRNSLTDAYTEAISTTDSLTGDVRTALRIRVLTAINDQLDAAVKRGDTAAADAYLEQSYKVAEALAKRGTDAGREINAYKLLAQHSPEAAVYQVQKDVAAQRVEAEAKLGKKAKKEVKAVKKAKAEALENTIATPAVRAVKEKVAGKQPLTSKEKIATIRAERSTLFDQLRDLTSNLNITPQQQAIAELHVKIFRSYVAEGITRVQSLVERIRKDAGKALAGVSDADLRKRAAAAVGDHNEAIRQGTEALGTTLDKIARDYLTDATAVGKSLADQFVEEAGLSPADAKAYAQAIEAEFAKRIGQARQRRIDDLNKRAAATPVKRASQTDLQKTQELFTLSPTDDAAILDHIKRVNELPELTAADVSELRGLAQKVQQAPEGFQKDQAVEALLKRQAQIKGINWAEIGSAMWYANVLSGYKTHVINFTANTVQTVAELAVGTTYAIGAGRGRYATAGAKGLFSGLKRGVREARSVLATGRETSRSPEKFEVPGLLEYITFAGGKANPANYLKYVNRALRAGDVLFSSGLKEMRAYEQAVKESLMDADSDGTPNQAIWERAAEKLYNTKQRVADARQQAQAEGLTGNDLERRVYEIAEQSRDAKLTEDAREYGTRAVFNGEVKGGLGWVATGIQHITTGIDINGFKPAKFLVPFTRVITSVANAYLDYTPIGALRAIKGSRLLGGRADSALQENYTSEDRIKLGVKAVTGASVALAAYGLSNNADDDDKPLMEITGAGTGNVAKDAQLRADGWQPYSVKIEGRWYSYANTPMGIMLAGVGNLNDGQKYRGELISDDEGALNSIYLSTFRALQFTKDMTALKGAADFLAAVDSRNPTQLTSWGQRLTAGSVKGYVPWSAMLTQLSKDAEMLNGQARKQGRSFGQMLYQDIPVARDGLNNALDALGDPIGVDTDRLFSSPPVRDASTQRIWTWMNKNNLFVPVPNRSSGGALVLKLHGGKEGPMTDDEYYRFMKKKGELLKAAIQTNLPQLEKKSPEKAKQWLLRHSARLNTIAKRKVFGPNALTAADKAGNGDKE